MASSKTWALAPRVVDGVGASVIVPTLDGEAGKTPLPVVMVVDEEKRAVAAVFRGDPTHGPLIAAAPALYEALRCLLEPSYSPRTAQHKARAALALADGKEGHRG